MYFYRPLDESDGRSARKCAVGAGFDVNSDAQDFHEMKMTSPRTRTVETGAACGPAARRDLE